MVQPGETVKVGRADDLFEENNIYRTEQQFTIDAICEDLERAGYAIQTFVVPACAVGAPHRRDRVWIVANSANARAESVQQGRKDRISELGVTIDTKCERWAKGGNEYGKSEISQEKECRAEQFSGTDSPQGWWRNFPTQSPVCSRDDGLPFRMADLIISFSKWRSKSIEALGNSWVPQVAYEIFKAIDNYDKMYKL